MDVLPFLAVISAAVILFLGLLTTAIMVPVYYVEKSSCYAFGRQANRDVRFVKFNLVSWDCLTPTQNGQWISTDRLRDID